MSAIRRIGVINDHGSLEGYRKHIIWARGVCERDLARCEFTHRYDRSDDLRMELIEWDFDLAWVDAELAADAMAA